MFRRGIEADDQLLITHRVRSVARVGKDELTARHLFSGSFDSTDYIVPYLAILGFYQALLAADVKIKSKKSLLIDVPILCRGINTAVALHFREQIIPDRVHCCCYFGWVQFFIDGQADTVLVYF